MQSTVTKSPVVSPRFPCLMTCQEGFAVLLVFAKRGDSFEGTIVESRSDRFQVGFHSTQWLVNFWFELPAGVKVTLEN